eukprot:6685218-Prymnesium_polylepis.1
MPAYNASDYPRCGEALTSSRRQWNYTAVSLGVERYPFSCHVMQVLHEQDSTLCPPAPIHMLDTNNTFRQQFANWTDTPDRCKVYADPMNIVVPLLLLVVVLTLSSKNKHKLRQLYHSHVRKPLAQMLRGGLRFRIAALLIGVLTVSTICSFSAMAIGAVVGEVSRALAQDPNDAVLSLGSTVIVQSSWAEVGGIIGAVLGAAIGMLATVVYARCRAHSSGRTVRSRTPKAAVHEPVPTPDNDMFELSEARLLLHPS